VIFQTDHFIEVQYTVIIFNLVIVQHPCVWLLCFRCLQFWTAR